MKNFKIKTIARWILPLFIMLLHIFYINKLYFYNIKIALHWGSYIILFLYLICMGEGKSLFFELQQGIRKLNFTVKAISISVLAFAGTVLIVYFFAKGLNLMYPLWQPLSPVGLIFWGIGYIILQPFVDTILYHKWLMGSSKKEVSKILIFLVAMLRTYVETGILIFDKQSAIPQEGFLALAFWLGACIFVGAYVLYRNVALSYMSEIIFRAALLITVFAGMSQFYILQM